MTTFDIIMIIVSINLILLWFLLMLVILPWLCERSFKKDIKEYAKDSEERNKRY